jgi:uncharacterized protein (TIGR02996 family)
VTATEIRIPDEFRPALDAAPEDFTLRLVLADWFAERGEVLAEDALRWSVAKGRVTYYSSSYYWHYWSQAVRAAPTNFLPEDLNDVMPEYEDEPNDRTRSVSAMFDRLLTGWASGTDEQRRQWWEWTPPKTAREILGL